MKIIGLAGKKRSGKDTIYNVAADLLEGRTGRVGFADAVKHEVSEATGFRMDFIEEHKKTSDCFSKCGEQSSEETYVEMNTGLKRWLKY